jgi:DNA-directed RNA polymerase II subunit RPB2
MVCSFNCTLIHMNKEERIRAGECEYDEGGYFIINGGEKIIVA